jgi:MFS superfamily sulfate permease-like transporter
MNSDRTSTSSKMKLRRLRKKDINEIKKTAQDMKKEFNKDMENFSKKNQTEILEIKSSLNQIKKYS